MELCIIKKGKKTTKTNKQTKQTNQKLKFSGITFEGELNINYLSS
jgi:hypothetical protein